MRAADYIMSFLVEKGVQDVFTVVGGGAIFLCDALAKNTDLNYIPCHHEQAVTMATEAYARVKNSVGVSLVTTGPGGTNAITGVAGSWIDSIPHFVLSGQVFSKQTIGLSGLRQLGIQELNIVDLVKPITKYAVMVAHASELKYHLEKAWYLATKGRPGPVWLDIPGDVQNAEINPDELPSFVPTLEDRVENESQFESKILAIATELAKAKRPLVHVGHGVRLSGAIDEFFQFIEKNKIPFVTARNANDIVDWHYPYYVGRSGTFGQRGANFAVQNCDFYLALGTRLSMPQTGYDRKAYAPKAFKVVVDIDQSELEKPDFFKIDIPLQADVKAVLQALNLRSNLAVNNTLAWQQQCANWKKQYPICLSSYKEEKKYVNSYYFVECLSEILTPDDIVVTDMGIAFQGTHQGFKVKKGQRFFTNSGFASMGWGLPAAVGAAVAHNNKRVICIAGEGGFMMNLQELATVMHQNLPIKVILINNDGYQTIRQSQELGFAGNIMGCDKNSGLDFPDFAKIAAAHRMPYVVISENQQIAGLLETFLAEQGPGVLEIVIDPAQPQAPRIISKQRNGKGGQPQLQDMWPFLEEKELAANMQISE